MSFRLPKNQLGQQSVDTGASILEVELLAERAASLGSAGLLVEKALHEFNCAKDEDLNRDTLLKRAADAVHSYFIQRELCGLCDQSIPIKEYAIPNEVLLRVGVK